MMAALLQSCDNGLSSSHFGWSGRFGVHPSGCPRPHGIIRHSSHPSHSSHNEQAKCYRMWQGRITFWGRRKLRPAILWYSLLPVSGCSRTGSIEVTWKNCWLGWVRSENPRIRSACTARSPSHPHRIITLAGAYAQGVYKGCSRDHRATNTGLSRNNHALGYSLSNTTKRPGARHSSQAAK